MSENKTEAVTRRDAKKETFLAALRDALGIITPACSAAGISRGTYYNWRADDAVFAASCDEIMEAQIDYVEGRLLERIRDNDTTGIIFYLKTKGKKRGYTERGDAGIAKAADSPTVVINNIQNTIQVRIDAKKEEIIQLMKDAGKFTGELVLQVESTAEVWWRKEELRARMCAPDYTPVITEYSREGSVRQFVNPIEKAYQDISALYQKHLKALGLNTDSKERSSDGDDVSADFLESHRMEDEP